MLVFTTGPYISPMYSIYIYIYILSGKQKKKNAVSCFVFFVRPPGWEKEKKKQYKKKAKEKKGQPQNVGQRQN